MKGANLYIDIIFLNKLKEILEAGRCTYYLLTDDDAKKMKDKGYEIDKKGRQVVYFNVESYYEDKYYIWQLNQKTCGKESVLFKIWMNEKYIEYKEKGIDTKLYKAIKYKPHDEGEDFIIEFGLYD